MPFSIVSPGSASDRFGEKQPSFWETFRGQIKHPKATSSTKAETSYVLGQQNSINNLANVIQPDTSCLLLPHPSIIQTHLVAQLQAEAPRLISPPKHNLPPPMGVCSGYSEPFVFFLKSKSGKASASGPAGGFPVPQLFL